jgi:hypothetical protein
VMVLELITPKPLSPLMAIVAVAPMLVVGTVINFQCWRRRISARRLAVPPPP